LAHEPKSSIFRLAAVLCTGIAKNHPFLDGNKRTALLTTRAFLYLTGFAFEPTEESEVVTLVGVAEGSVGEAELERWLRDNSHRRAKETKP